MDAANVKVSVIVPFYNAFAYFDECLDRLIKQSLKEIEILLINDGSIDQSKNLVHKYQESDSRVILIDQLHTGPGAARNKGIDLARGTYITFVDSDDRPEPDYCSSLYKTALEQKADIIVGQVRNIKDKKLLSISSVSRNDFKALELIKEMYRGSISMGIYSKLYKINLLREHKIYFPDSLYLEDRHFLLQALYYSNKVYFLDEIIYTRNIRDDSVMNKIDIKRIKDIFEIISLDIMFLKHTKLFPSVNYLVNISNLKVLIFIYQKLSQELIRNKGYKTIYLYNLSLYKLNFNNDKFYKNSILKFSYLVLTLEVQLGMPYPFFSNILSKIIAKLLK